MMRDNDKYNEGIDANTEFLNELKEKLPNFFSSYDKFDLDKFKNALSKNNIEELNDGYQLEFIGKDYARRQSGELPTTVIVPDEEHNKNNNSKNLFFTGDNIEVLRHLQNNYKGKIDFIYIDPPYNTGNNDFVYPDNFEYTDDKLKQIFGMNDEQVERLKSIRGSSSHSAWLTFMYPRILLGKKLLSENGAIFISIDNNEHADLQLLMNDIFGEELFMGDFIWVRKKKGSFLNKQIRKMTEYILYFDKNHTNRVNYGEKAYSNKMQPIVKRTNSLSELIFPKNVIKTKLKNGVYPKIKAEKDTGITFNSEIHVNNGIVINELSTSGHYTWSQEFLNKEILSGSEVWLSSNFAFNVKRSGQDERIKAPSTLIDKHNNVGTYEDSTEYLSKLFDVQGFFQYSKPVSLIKYLIRMSTWNNKDATILDFFAGSSTTADAVMTLNAEENSKRKFIMVQLPERTYTIDSNGNKKPTIGGKIAYKSGFNSIDQISRERILKSASKIRNDFDLTLDDSFDGDFKHYRVINPNEHTLDEIDKFDPNAVNLFSNMVDKFSSSSLGVSGNASGEQTILTTWLAKDGYKFDVSIDTINFNGYEGFIVNNNRLYLINEGWTSNETQQLLNALGNYKLNIQAIVIFGYSFGIADLRELELGLKQLDINVNLLKRY